MSSPQAIETLSYLVLKWNWTENFDHDIIEQIIFKLIIHFNWIDKNRNTEKILNIIITKVSKNDNSTRTKFEFRLFEIESHQIIHDKFFIFMITFISINISLLMSKSIAQGGGPFWPPLYAQPLGVTLEYKCARFGWLLVLFLRSCFFPLQIIFKRFSLYLSRFYAIKSSTWLLSLVT